MRTSKPITRRPLGRTRRLSGMLPLLTLAFSAAAGRAAVTFASPEDYRVPNGSQDVAVADINGDGFPDIIVTNNGASCISVLLNDPAKPGSFLPPISYPLSAAPMNLAVADLNGDGLPDAAVTSATGRSVTILLNTAGVLRVTGTYSIGGTPNAITAAPLSSTPGAPADLLIPDASGVLNVFRNKGGGVFSGPTTIATGMMPRSAAVADLDGDGVPDVAVGNASARTISILKGNGQGGLTKAQDIAVSGAPYSVRAVRLNPAGAMDIVAGNGSTGGIIVIRGTGGGQFAAPEYATSGRGSNAIALGDFDVNGLPDVATANYASYDVSLFLGLGDGLTPSGTFAAGSYRNGIAVADLDRNGLDDIVLCNTGFSVSVLLNTSVFVGGFSLKDNAVPAGMATRGTITLTGPAPVGGTVIPLSVDGDPRNPIATTPPDVVIAAGENSVSFDVVGWRQGSATITAEINGKPQRVALTVGPPPTGGGSKEPTGLSGDLDGDGRVTLNDVVMLLRVANGDGEIGS